MTRVCQKSIVKVLHLRVSFLAALYTLYEFVISRDILLIWLFIYMYCDNIKINYGSCQMYNKNINTKYYWLNWY